MSCGAEREIEREIERKRGLLAGRETKRERDGMLASLTRLSQSESWSRSIGNLCGGWVSCDGVCIVQSGRELSDGGSSSENGGCLSVRVACVKSRRLLLYGGNMTKMLRRR